MISKNQVHRILEKGQEFHNQQILESGIDAGLVKHGKIQFSYSESLEPLMLGVLGGYRKGGWKVTILEEYKVEISE